MEVQKYQRGRTLPKQYDLPRNEQEPTAQQDRAERFGERSKKCHAHFLKNPDLASVPVARFVLLPYIVASQIPSAMKAIPIP